MAKLIFHETKWKRDHISLYFRVLMNSQVDKKMLNVDGWQQSEPPLIDLPLYGRGGGCTKITLTLVLVEITYLFIYTRVIMLIRSRGKRSLISTVHRLLMIMIMNSSLKHFSPSTSKKGVGK